MTNATQFDLGLFIERVERRIRKAAKVAGDKPSEAVRRFWAATAEGSHLRIEATRADPLLFALLYFPHHLRSAQTKDRITFGDAHLDWARDAKRLMTPVEEAAENRHAYIAPREMGKSTWHFLIIPAWAAAHGHVKFIAAFADASEQAEIHLASFKHELENNELLRLDYGPLCEPLKRNRGITAADRVSLYRSQSGFVFAARGMDTKTLGLKVGSLRPDYILLDDIEPGEEKYSADAVKKRLSTLQDTVLPLNDKARVTLVGTVTRPGSIIHQLVKAARGLGTAEWITDDSWQPHYYAPIITDPDGSERSIWPARWSLKRLKRIRHTRAYLKNYANDPMGADGDYWTLEDLKRGLVQGVTRILISIDPAVTTRDTSDFTGIAVVGWRPPKVDPKTRKRRGRGACQVFECRQVKKSGAEIRRIVLELITKWNAGLVLIEVNQGGDVWQQILWGMPVKVKTKHQTEKKEVRAAAALDHYQRNRVFHSEGLNDLEEQMTSFPDAPHDDMVDAVVTGVLYFLGSSTGVKAGVGLAHAA